MHQHKIVVQILLMLTVLNSVLAAPVVHVREIPKARGAVAVRVPAEGMTAVLKKRPYVPPTEPGTSAGPSPGNPEPQLTSPENTGPQSATLPGNAGPQSTTNPEHTGPQPTNPEHTGPQPTSPEHTAPQSEILPEHPGPQSGYPPDHSGLLAMTDEYSGSQRTTGEIQHYASSSVLDAPQARPARVSNAAWRQKILTPEKIKATKYAAGAALLTSAYLGLLLPEIFNNEGSGGNKS
jgi:hypothetical protein